MRRALLGLALIAAGHAQAQAQALPDAPAAATASVPIDPARLDAARKLVLRLIPPGTYKTVMRGAMGAVADNLSDTIKALPLRQIAELGGLSPKQAEALDRVDVARIMAIYDPHWEERTTLGMRAMFDAMGDFFTTIEPDLRESMARAYANQFSLADLQDLDRYFATPTGARFAARYMTVMNDPAVIDATKAMVPKLMAQMPSFIAAMQKATAALPPPRKIEDLTAKEKDDLAAALGVDAASLKDPKSKP